ncbi:polysaccharide exporter for spore cortex synthesis [Alkalihalophilus pseudofirmus OF4]|uniref:Polysaccharide exporter for spore cortex synthesis n=1 Tax=Alkalihalophilus pseudofirmus (strain ATCC BAA-2126 / JCM 17055 / OF4) TaxID=398511 RepID=D3FVW4_ALKPO|nr:stage V sporulation protein B [Alkalihalophilus pseudofirmus]ADC50396.1 polysaccharide exporter for spore cortex synthesis [Alkalihalophilus pseudofirmus OF4]
MSKQTFIKGTLILIIAGLITRFLGFVNKIVVARIMGAEGVGLYMMAVPTLLLVITITQLGLPVAISKLVAEAEAKGDRSRIKKILVVSLAITGTLSIIFTAAMILFAPIISKTMLTDARAYYPLIAIAPIVPIVALSSVMRGYFQGRQNMKPTAYSQVIEQVVRITLVAVMTSAFLPMGVEYAAAGAMISVVFGELASLLYMIYMFKSNKRFKIRSDFFSYVKEGKHTFNDLMRIALPTTGSRLIGSISLFFEPIVVAQSLALAGVATVMATRQYGELAGFVIPLILLPTFITYSLSVSLVPAISEAAAKKQFKTIHHRLGQALRLALISGGVSVVVLYVYAEPIMELMYNAPSVATYVKVMAPFSIFLYFQGPLQATLQALDLAKAAMMNSLFGAVVKIGAIFALATRPELGIMGAALAIVIGFILVTLLHFATVVKTVSFTIDIKLVVKVILLIGSSTWIGFLCLNHAFLDQSLVTKTLLSISITTLFYSILMIFLGLIKREELNRIPVVGRYAAKLVPKE